VTQGNGSQPSRGAEKSIGEVVADVSQKASLLVREEIELAKAEVAEKAGKLAKGAGVGAAAGVFLFFMVFFLLHALAFFLNDAFNWPGVWPGYAVVTGLLLLLAIVAGLLAFRWIKGGAPPTPDLAIEEAKRTREELEHQKIQRDQVGRTLEKGEEITA
jgi:hypothetical protein